MEAVRFVVDMALNAEEELPCVEVTANRSAAWLVFLFTIGAWNWKQEV